MRRCGCNSLRNALSPKSKRDPSQAYCLLSITTGHSSSPPSAPLLLYLSSGLLERGVELYIRAFVCKLGGRGVASLAIDQAHQTLQPNNALFLQYSIYTYICIGTITYGAASFTCQQTLQYTRIIIALDPGLCCVDE